MITGLQLNPHGSKGGGDWVAESARALRKRYGAGFKAKRALEALRSGLTTSRPAMKHGMRQTMGSDCKRQAVEGSASVFSGKKSFGKVELETPHAKVGQLAAGHGCAGLRPLR